VSSAAPCSCGDPSTIRPPAVEDLREAVGLLGQGAGAPVGQPRVGLAHERRDVAGPGAQPAIDGVVERPAEAGGQEQADRAEGDGHDRAEGERHPDPRREAGGEGGRAAHPATVGGVDETNMTTP
jgi:hypothetical protein